MWFGLSTLNYCRNMAVQHGGLCGRGPTPSIDIQELFSGKENTMILILRGLNTCKYILLNIILKVAVGNFGVNINNFLELGTNVIIPIDSY